MRPSGMCGVLAGEPLFHGKLWEEAQHVGSDAARPLFPLTSFDRNTSRTAVQWLTHKYVVSVRGKRGIHVRVVHWDMLNSFSFNVSTWRVFNSPLLPSLFSDSITECSHNCYGNGECVAGSCHCFPGFIGPYCSRGNYPARLFPAGVAFLAFSLLTSDISQQKRGKKDELY